MRCLKILGLGLVGVILFVGMAITAAAVGGAPLIVHLIENQGSALVGREIRLGQLDISWGRRTRVVAEHITVANAAWGSKPNMLAVGRLEMAVEPGALLRLKLVVPHLTLEEGSLLLETSADGARNWAPFAAVGAPQRRPQVQRLLIRSGVFLYHNGQTGAETKVAADELLAETLDGVSPINITAKGTFQEDRIALTATVGAVKQLESPSEPYPVTLKGSLGANDIALNGMIADPLATQGLDLHVEMNGQDIQDVLAMLGVPIPKMPIYQLRGRVHRDGPKWWLEDVTGRVGASLLAGRILVDTGQQVPYIRADLTSSFLDLADLQGLYGGEPKQLPARDEKRRSNDLAEKKSGRVIPDVRLPIGKLLGFNADFSLDSSNVKPTDGFPVEHVTLGVSLKDGTLRLKPVRVAIARGELLGDLEYRSAVTPPQFRGDIDVHHIDLTKLFAGAAVSNSLKQTAGIVGGYAKLSSAGTTQRQILAQLGGDVGIFVQGGRLGQKLGGAFESTLAEALGLISKKDEPPHPVNCLMGRAKIARGIATAETLLLDTAETIVAGRGNINIGDETIFLDVKPYPKHGSTRRVGVPFAIRGTFADPNVTADKVGLMARLGAAIGIGDETPPGALLQLLEAGLGEKNSCSNTFSKQESVGQGSTGPPRRRR